MWKSQMVRALAPSQKSQYHHPGPRLLPVSASFVDPASCIFEKQPKGTISAPLFKARPSSYFFLSFVFDLHEASQETISTFSLSSV